MGKRDEQAINTKNRLIYTTLQLIREEGYPALTIRHLCERSGVSTGAFYHHFSSKEDLINSSFTLFDDTLKEQLKNPVSDNPVEMIKYIIMSSVRYLLEKGEGFAKEVMISQLSVDESFMARKERFYYQSILKYVKEAQEKGLIKSSIDPEYIANMLIRTNRGTVLDWCLNNFSFDVIEESRKDLDMIMGQFTV